MIEFLFSTVSIFFAISVIRNILFWLHLWQIKEYRIDRLIIHLNETVQGRGLLYGKLALLKYFSIILYAFTIIYPTTSDWYNYVVFVVFGITTISVIKEFRDKKFRIPIITLKIIIIFFIVVATITTFYFFYPVDRFFWLLFLDKLTVIIVAVLISFFWIPTEFYKDYLLYKAAKKIPTFKKLKVIGITGSYGKGSTKEFMSIVLSEKFNVVRTHGTFNTALAISRTVLSEISNKTDIFVVELGAYKVGEINDICDIIRPNIGVLTAVNDQHISLFGSLKKTMKAKYELIDHLPKNGLALFNANNPYSLELFKSTRKKKVLYYSSYSDSNIADEKKLEKQAHIIATNIIVHKLFTTCDIMIPSAWKTPLSIRVNVLGVHNIENLLPAVYIANHLGMNREEIKRGALRIFPLPKTLQAYQSRKGVTFIDDTFNANPESVISAVSYTKNYKGKKVIVLQPMIELGKRAVEQHRRVAGIIAKEMDVLILTNENFYSEIEKEFHSANPSAQLFLMNPKNTSMFILKNLRSGDVVIFEGKESSASMSNLDYEKIN